MFQPSPDSLLRAKPIIRPLRVLSVCSGISAASAAFAGLPMEVAAFAEIDPAACWVLHRRLGVGRPRRMPDPEEIGIDVREMRRRRAAIRAVSKIPDIGKPNFGDFTQIRIRDLRELGTIDVLEGGTPCQAFSMAGLRGGLNDDRGNLALAYTRLAHDLRMFNDLKFALWENVPGTLVDRGNAFGCFLASLAGERDPLVPAGRSWSRAGYADVERGANVAWRILDAQYFGTPTQRRRLFALASFGAGCAGDLLFEREGTRGRFEPCEFEGPSTAGVPSSGDRRPLTNAAAFDLVGHGRYEERGTPCLRAKGGDCGGGSETLVVQGGRVRRLTPLECERLTGFPDGWTAVEGPGGPLADLPRYRLLGNSMSVPVMTWLGQRISAASGLRFPQLVHDDRFGVTSP